MRSIPSSVNLPRSVSAVTGALTEAVEELNKDYLSVQSLIQDAPRKNSFLFQGVWANFGSGYQPAEYWIDALGVVHLHGVIVRAGGTGLTETIAVLPTGFTPSIREIFGVAASGAFGRVDVQPTGLITFETGTAATYLSLSGISFVAAR